MNNKLVKATSLLLSAALLLGTCGLTGCAKKEPITAAELKPAPVPGPVTQGTGVPDKEDTVYVLSGPDGTASQVIVSSWLQNRQHHALLEDASELQNIENVNGTETFTQEDGKLVWNAGGRDIYYQGSWEQPLPVTMKVSFTLDGNSVTPEDLAGQSGKVTIRFDYENQELRETEIDGKKETVHVPFLMVTGVMLDTEVFRNVTVTSGHLENLGNEIAVVGLALPGMQENLQLSEDTLSIPDYVEIRADAENFRMGPTMTLGTAALLRDLDEDALDPECLRQQARKLTEGMGQLMDGAARLSDGLNALLEQSGALSEGVGQLSGGAAALQAGVSDLSGGVSQLQAGAAALRAGLGALDENSAALTGGAEQVFVTLLHTASQQLKDAGLTVPELTIQNYGEVLTGIIGSLDESAVYEQALQQVTGAVEARREEITAAVTQAVRQQVEAQVLEQVTAAARETVAAAVQAQESRFREAVIRKATGMTPELYEKAVKAGLVTKEQQQAIDAAVAAAMEAEVEKQMEGEAVQAQIAAATESALNEQMKSPEIQALIAQNTEAQVQKAISDAMASPQVQETLQSAAQGAQAVIALKTSLDSYNSFYLGLMTYTSGVSQAAAGASDLASGADTLKGGVGTLQQGVGTLRDGLDAINGKMPQLTQGVTDLRDGSAALQDGLSALMEEGIRKIADLAQEDLTRLSQRLRACAEASRQYDSFSGKAETAKGSVKFLYKTQSVESGS